MVGWLLCAALSVAAGDLSIGFVSHYPLIREQDDLVAQTGANVMTVRAPWAVVEPRPGEFDFGLLDEQLAWAEAQDVKLVLLLEGGPAHAAGVGWLINELRAADQMQADATGAPQPDPSFFSATYREYLQRFIARTAAAVRAHPLGRRVVGYNNGCEYWYPLNRSYGREDRVAFRAAMRARAGDLDALAQRWGATLGSWDEVAPPVVFGRGVNAQPQGWFAPPSEACDLSFADTRATPIRVEPGQRYRFALTVDQPAGPVAELWVQVAWVGARDDQIVGRANGAQATGPGRVEVVVEAEAPVGAERAWLHLKLAGPGAVTIRRASFTDAAGRELAPNPGLDPAAGGWQVTTWSAGDPAAVTTELAAPGAVALAYAPAGGWGVRWPLAWVDDWFAFRAESHAAFMQWFAAQIKAADPTRPVITYTTFAFANPFEWDYTQQMAVESERVARLGADCDVFGLQLNSTLGDADSVACALDMVRRFGKPLWAIDLLDFSAGTDLGEARLAALTQTVLRHGGSGVQYYCWWGTPRYNYLDLGLPALTRLLTGAAADYAALPPAPAVRTALVQPRMPLITGLPEPANDWADFMGWYKLLARAGERVDVWTSDDLSDLPAGRYARIVVPDCAYLDPVALGALRAAQGAGAKVVSSGRLAHRDRTGRPLAAGRLWQPTLSLPSKPGAEYLGRTYRVPSPSDTPPRLRCAEGSPDETVRRTLWARLRAAGIVAGG